MRGIPGDPLAMVASEGQGIHLLAQRATVGFVELLVGEPAVSPPVLLKLLVDLIE